MVWPPENHGDLHGEVERLRTAPPNAHGATHVPGGSDPLYSQFGHNLPGVEVVPRYAATGSVTPSQGVIYVTFVTPEQDETVTEISYASGATAGVGQTLVRFGIWEATSETTAVLRAETASDTTIYNAANTLYTRALSTARGGPASYTMLRGVRYGISTLCVGATTAPSVRAAASTIYAIQALPPRMMINLSGQTDHPAIGGSITSNFNSGLVPWGYAG